MNLPFGLPNVKETALRRYYETAEVTALYEHKLAEYRDILESYKKCILEYSDKLDGYDKRSMNNQLSIVQMALDMTYLKEQGDKTIELLSVKNTDTSDMILKTLVDITASMTDTKDNLDSLDKNVVNRLSELVLELQRQSVEHNRLLQAEVLTGMDKLTRKVKRGNILLWFFVIINLLTLGTVAFFGLYYFDMIPF